jgi:nucleoside-diphosphate-sugar epimerase
MKVLITGGAGYIGSILTREMLKKGFKVTVIDNFFFNQSNIFNDIILNKNFKLIKKDVRNSKFLKSEISKNDIIIPLAGIVGAPLCKKKPILTKQINFEQIKNIKSFVSKNQIVILPVTNSGYGIGKIDKVYYETSDLNPISLYGKTKVAAEKVIQQHHNYVTLRLATVFGLSNRMRTDLLVNDFTYKAFKKKNLILFEQHFKRNFIHIRDVCSAIIYSLDNFKKFKNQTFNVGLEDANLSKLELALKIKKYVKSLEIFHDKKRKDPDKRNYIVSNKKILSTGWKPNFSLDDGIKELLIYYQNFKLTNDTNNVFVLKK